MCRSGPSSIPARRRWCTSSGSRGCLKGWKSSLGRATSDYYPVIKGLKPGDKVAAAGGFLIDAETRLNPAAASTYFGASGGPQSSGRPSAPSAPSQRQGDQAPADQGKPDSGQPKPEPSQVAVAAPDGRRPREHRATARGRPETGARAAAFAPSRGAALGSMGVPVKITLRGQTGLPVLQRVHGQGQAKPGRNAEETGGCRRSRAER